MDSEPALLSSHAYLNGAVLGDAPVRFRDWAMDSGAFTAHNAGSAISLPTYMAAVRDALHRDPKLVEVFALDVIGNAEASLANAEVMLDAGLPVIPTFHFGSDLKHLRHLCERFPKVALGGMAARIAGTQHGQAVSLTSKRAWLRGCFAIAWPKRLHAFGCTDERVLRDFPFESCDASSWTIQPQRYGLWRDFGRLKVRDTAVTRLGLRHQMDSLLRVEHKLRGRWHRTHAAAGIKPFTLRFVVTPAFLSSLTWLRKESP